MARDKTLAYLWPDSTSAKARAALEQMLHALRVSLDDRSLLLGNPLRLDPAVVSSDVAEFREAVATGNLERAASLYEGPFLDGFYLSDVPEFEQWATSERSRLESQYVAAIEKLATQAAARGDRETTSQCLRALGSVTLPSAAAVRRFVEALAAAGDSDGGVEFATQYAARVRAELGVEPDTSVAAAAARLRSHSNDQSQASTTHGEPAGQTVRQNRGRSTAYRVGMVAVAAVLALAGGWVWFSRSNGPGLDPNVIAVMPFRVTAPDSSYNYLREGVIDLLNARLTGDSLPRGVDSRTLLIAWHRRAGTANELTQKQSRSLARQLGAGKVLTGSFVVTANKNVLSASLHDVRLGHELLTHRDDAAGEDVQLIDRLTLAVLAQHVPKGRSRSRLSDSLAAVKEYLAGLRAARANQWVEAGRHYTRALSIDSAFAQAALRQWEAVLAGSAFPRPTSPPFTDADFNLAWSLRDRLNTRDELYLKALGAYYLQSDSPTQAAAMEAAARAAPDDAKAWALWGNILASASPWGVPNWLQRSAAVLDSAIALDSTDVDPVQFRLRLALHVRNAADIRRYLRLYEQLAPRGEDADAFRWAAGQALHDERMLQAMRKRLATLSPQSVFAMGLLALTEGLPISDVQDALELRRVDAVKSSEFSGADAAWLFHVLAARGGVRAALTLADSMTRVPDARLFFAERIIRQAILEPGTGYDSAAAHIAPSLADELEPKVRSYPVSERSAYCLANVYQLLRGDSTRARRAIAKLTSIADTSPLFALRDTRGGTCPALLEVLADPKRSLRRNAPSLQRLDSLIARGLYWDRIAPTAGVLLARLQESEEKYAAALATSRRRSRGTSDYRVSIWPAVLRIEGRLAAMVGDTLGAVRAYTHYLTLRDKPDPGAMANEVAEVRAHLAQLRRGATR